MANDVQFRRIRGRIVPIFSKKQKKDAAIGAVSVGAGAAIAGAGYRAQRMASIVLRKQSTEQFRKFIQANETVKGAGFQQSFGFMKRQHIESAQKIIRSAKRNIKVIGFSIRRLPIVGAGGKLLGATVAGYGAAKLLEAAKPKSSETERLATAASTGFAVASFASKLGLASKPLRSKMVIESLKTLRKRLTRGILR